MKHISSVKKLHLRPRLARKGKQGFALVVSLSLMVLLTILAAAAHHFALFMGESPIHATVGKGAAGLGFNFPLPPGLRRV